MRKELKLIVNDKQNGLPMKAVLSKSLGLSRREISRLKFASGILLNGETCKVTQLLKTGDEIKLIFPDRDTAHAVRILGTPDILYEDDDLVIVNKPAGMPCHPSHEHLDDDMGTLLQNWYKESFTVRAVGRLDKDVSGVMLYAKNQPAAARLSKERDKDILRKEYIAFAEGHFEKKKGVLTYSLAKVEGRKDRKISSGGQKCITEYEVLKEFPDFSVVKIHIVTGRTHQIRAGMAHFEHPLLGDSLYGGSNEKMERPALHCATIRLVSPFSDQEVNVEAELPDDMKRLSEESKNN